MEKTKQPPKNLKNPKTLSPFKATVITHFDIFTSMTAIVHVLPCSFLPSEVAPLAPPTGSCLHKEGKAAYLVHMSAGGVLPTHCRALPEHPEAQSGGPSGFR